MDCNQKLKYQKCKYILKKWESEFKAATDKLPTKSDIKCAPKRIKEAYKTYWTLKRSVSSGECTSSNIHEDENAKDCFNSSSETVEEISLRAKDVSKSSSNVLEDSICFHAVSDTLTETKFELNLQEHVIENNKVDSSKSETSVIECIAKNEKKSDLNQLTPTSFKNLFSGGNDRTFNGPILLENNNLLKVSLETENKKSEVRSVSYQYAEKLYAGSKFNKRNPRKPRSFSKQNKMSKTPNKDTTVPAIFSNETDNLPEKEICKSPQGINNLSSFSPSLLNDEDFKDSEFLGLTENCKIVTQTSVVSTRAVSLLQSSFDNSNVTKHSVTRNIDKGWLERISNPHNIIDKKIESNLAESQDSGISSIKTDSLSDSINNFVSLESTSNIHDDSSNDLIYDSDCDTGNSSVFKLNLLEKLNRSTNLDLYESDHKVPQNTSKFVNNSFLCKTDKNTNQVEDNCVNGVTFIPQQDNLFKSNNKRCLFDEIDDMPLSKRLKSDNEYDFQSVTKPEIIVPFNLREKKSKIKKVSDQKQEHLVRKLASGEANQNFVKINIEKKKYARGKKTMTFSKYKKQKWKNMKKNNTNESCGILKCFKCGDIGHFSKACPKTGMDALLPLEDYDSADESPFPTLEEAAEMAKEAAEMTHINGRKFTVSEKAIIPELPVYEPSCSTMVKPLFELSPDGSLMTTPASVYSALKELGHDEFRPGQEKGIMRILSGLSTVVTLSTGSGKSLIYQLPAYMFNKAYPGCITLVISPLVSLMEDQVFCGSKKLRAACLHHNMTQKKREVVLEALKSRSISVLLIAPESLSSWDSAKSLLKLMPPIAFACIDEAHSISQHSHNFRPSYLTICQLLREKMGISTLLGLTATASYNTLKTVMSQLDVNDASSIISDIPLPDNLFLTVSTESDRREALLTLLYSERFCHCASIIIYCTRREECDKLAAFLRVSLQDHAKSNKKGRLSIHAEAYHAGLTAGRRNQVQSAFMSGQLRIVVATVAFGMGLNKNDIRGIIHYNMPSSFENYVQEIGRAGRDKKPAQCHLFLDAKKNDLSELKRHIYADTVDRHVIRKLLELVFVPCECVKKHSEIDPGDTEFQQLNSENHGNSDDCYKHEVAFPIESTITSLDLPQEVVSTLLAYLQLDDKKWIKLLPYAYTKCKVTSYKGARHLKKIARNCAPLAVVIAEENKSVDKAFVEFDIVKLARKINWDSGTLKHYLKQLEWTTVDGKPQKSGILTEFSCLGFRMLSPGNLTDLQLDQALNLLHSIVKSQEEMRIKQLNMFYDLLNKVSHDSVEACCNIIDQENFIQLKTDVRKYFTSVDPLAQVKILEEEIEEEMEVAADIRRFIATYRSENNFTGRIIAKIFHGIGTPNFPPIVWGRTKFWRLHLDKDFNSLVKLATKQLILMR